jgi:tetratricopeptide (TPR) repeat protein
MQNYAEAMKCFNSVIELESNNCEAHDFKGNCLFKLKKYTDALEEYTTAHKIDPQNQIYLKHVNLTKVNLILFIIYLFILKFYFS